MSCLNRVRDLVFFAAFRRLSPPFAVQFRLELQRVQFLLVLMNLNRAADHAVQEAPLEDHGNTDDHGKQDYHQALRYRHTQYTHSTHTVHTQYTHVQRREWGESGVRVG